MERGTADVGTDDKDNEAIKNEGLELEVEGRSDTSFSREMTKWLNGSGGHAAMDGGQDIRSTHGATEDGNTSNKLGALPDSQRWTDISVGSEDRSSN